ncbi:hypothetical protein DFH08DRAFT_981703 [Mycena albidolilacea]|uniref:F-box domain-containing protein n=1 Tax=Mycena albidolilacea TaxID=1033008 RepID=A0AAD7AUS3_9AGAR|nr:hypothetical protein DFH08DRAFT_981703 [Mycena albidolilacea]
MTGLQNIPAELIEAVCHQLDVLSIVRLTQVSRQFWRIFGQSSALQYKVQLELAGLRDVCGKAGSASRLELLKAYQATWTTFECTRSTKTTVNMAGESWELVGNVLATYSSEKGFFFHRIPSALRQVPPAEWCITDLPVGVKDFSLDLSQDLLLVVELTSTSTVVHLLSLKTGTPHPLARNPHFSRDFDEPGALPEYCHCQIRIFGEYIGVMVQSESHDQVSLFVWEWKSGVMKQDVHRDDMTSFAFLDHRMLLIGILDSFSAELRVLEIEETRSDSEKIQSDSFKFSFELPAWSHHPEVAEIDMTIQTEPATSWATDSVLDEPFTTGHADRLFVVSFWTQDASFLLCVRLSTLLNLMEYPPADTKSRTMVWDEWGPANARMLRIPGLPDPWVCFVHGQRCVIQISPIRCQILDFNPLSTWGKCILHEKTVDNCSLVFQDPVTTWAPFTLTSIETSPSAAVMLAEDGIVTVSVDEDSCTIFSV